METYVDKKATIKILSDLNVITTLVDGKVAIINDAKTGYEMVKPFDNVTIPVTFDPTMYALHTCVYITYEKIMGLKWNQSKGKHVKSFIDSKYLHQYTSYRIGYSTSYDRKVAQGKIQDQVITDLYNKQISDKLESEKTVNPAVYNLKPGNKIHIKSRQGIYEVISVDYYTITITCNKWSVDGSTPHKIISKADFKCYAGGLWNSGTFRF